MSDEHLHFVTGQLAARSLRRVVEAIATAGKFEYTIEVLPITVAALMTPDWIARKCQVPGRATRLILPGYCDGDLDGLQRIVNIPIDVGPRDLHALPEFFGQAALARQGYGAHEIEIIAEINHAPRMERDLILAEARHLAEQGADVIDIGCIPGQRWNGTSDCVKALRDAGFRVSIDSFDPEEIAAAAAAGAELVLSVNKQNREAAADWGCEVVAIPDDIATSGGLDQTIEILERDHVRYRIDPVLEPIGYGFAASLGRYLAARDRFPRTPMMMGIGNLTELTDADSAGINVLLLGFCAELRIGSVLTTQVINWARSSVRECDLARRLVHYAVTQGVLPKHVEADLILLRDEQIYEQGEEQLRYLATQIKDRNYRIFAESGKLHLINGDVHLTDDDPFTLFDQLMSTNPRNLDESHSFYLGYELAKALTALTLGKQYRQDEALDWGFLTVPQPRHRSQRPGAEMPNE